MLVRVEIELLALIDVVALTVLEIVAWIVVAHGDDVVRNNIECRAMAQHVPK